MARFVGPKRSLIATRRGNWETSTLEVEIDGERVFGERAEQALRGFLCDGDDVPIGTLLQNSGILQQDVMRQVLEAHPSERHQFISALLGLGSLEDLQADVLEAAKALRQRAQKANLSSTPRRVRRTSSEAVSGR